MTSDEITPANWREHAEHIHVTCMNNMEVDLCSIEERNFLILAAAGEMGELANVQKKIWRDGPSEELYRKLDDEIADVLIYLEHLCKSRQVDPDVICARKLEEVRHRPYAQTGARYTDTAPGAGGING